MKKLLAIVGSVALLFLFRAPDAASVPAPIRVVQWNVFYDGTGTDGVVDRRRQVASLAARDPDVVTLNEVTRGAATDYKLQLERALGERWYHHHAAAGDATWGNAVLSRFPIVSSSSVALGGAQRSVAQATILVGEARVNVFATHLDSGDRPESRARQAERLLEYVGVFPAPHLLAGDLNAAPDAEELQPLFVAFVDAWDQTVKQNTARAYADNPPGRYTRTRRTRLDYVLASADATLIPAACEIPDLRDRARTNLKTLLRTADDRGVRPSDHNLVSCTFEWTAAPLPSRVPWTGPDNAGTGGTGDVILWPASGAALVGDWSVVLDPAAAGGARVENPDARQAKTRASAEPDDYFEMTFDAEAGRPYRLWMRARAANDNWTNDSVSVQFSGSIDAAGEPMYRIGTMSRAMYSLEECVNCGVSGWGWQDNGFGLGVLGPEIYFARTGMQTIRVQRREDGVSIDQIVLSSDTWLTSAPGPAKEDDTILPATSGNPASIRPPD